MKIDSNNPQVPVVSSANNNTNKASDSTNKSDSMKKAKTSFPDFLQSKKSNFQTQTLDPLVEARKGEMGVSLVIHNFRKGYNLTDEKN